MQDGSLLDRFDKPYKPSTCRSFALAVSKYLNADRLARKRVTEVQRADVQDYVDRLEAYHRAGVTTDAITARVTDEASEKAENPAVAGLS
jgi:hypothetical protein